jgi:hypothetical protein
MAMAAQNPSQLGSRLGRAVLGLGLAGMGGLFVALMWASYLQARETYHWAETPCHIVRSEVEEFRPTPHSPPAYRYHVGFAYSAAGAQQVSVHRAPPRRNPWTTNHRARAEALAARYPVGSDAVCYVDPGDPAMAVLERGSKGPLYAIWFPALFVAGGLGIAAGALRPGGRHPTGGAAGVTNGGAECTSPRGSGLVESQP